MSIVPNTFSIRNRIMGNLVDRFKSKVEGQDGYSVTWNSVRDAPLTKTEIGSGNVLGIFDTAEAKYPEVGYFRCHLTVIIEFFYKINIGDSPSVELNRLLLDVQRTVREDINCGGLSVNIVELRNELDVSGSADRLVAGMVEYQVVYRHSLNDPRRYV